MSIRKRTYVAFDIETTGFLKYEGDRIFSYVTTNWVGGSCVRRLDRKNKRKNRKWLQDFFYDTSIAKIAHNAKFELSFLRAEGIIVPEETEWHDTMIMSQMLNNIRKKHSLDYLAKIFYDYDTSIDDLVHAEARKHASLYKKNNPKSRINLSGFDKVTESLMDKYQIADGERCMLLYQLFAPKIFENRELYLDYLHEIKLIKTSIRMEEKGVLLDNSSYKKVIVETKVKELLAEKNLRKYKEAKYTNFNSPKSLQKLMIDKLNLEPIEFTKTGAPKIDKAFLLHHRDKNSHPIIDDLLKYRSYSRGISMLTSYKNCQSLVTGRIHPNLKTNSAKTGRQSCSDPNLQSVQKEKSIRSVHAVSARRCFRATPAHKMHLVDYAGIELRLIVDTCNEKEFIDAINTGKDVHNLASSVLYGDNWQEINLLINSPNGVKIPTWVDKLKDIERSDTFFSDVKKRMRDGEKNFVFGSSYGGAYKAITEGLLGLSESQRQEGFNAFKERWSKLSNFTPDLIKVVKKQGFVTTAFGRDLYVKKGQEYMAANYIIQGTASGILKRAETRIDEYSMYELDEILKLILTIHDEAIIETPIMSLEREKEIMKNVYELMTTFEEIKVKLEVESKTTQTTWDKAELAIIQQRDFHA